jgi:hypothetical protein
MSLRFADSYFLASLTMEITMPKNGTDSNNRIWIHTLAPPIKNQVPPDVVRNDRVGIIAWSVYQKYRKCLA